MSSPASNDAANGATNCVIPDGAAASCTTSSRMGGAVEMPANHDAAAAAGSVVITDEDRAHEIEQKTRELTYLAQIEGAPREPLSHTIKSIMEFVESRSNNDPLLCPLRSKDNPFQKKKACALM